MEEISQPIAVEFPSVTPFKGLQCDAPGRKRIPPGHCEERVEQTNNEAGFVNAVFFTIVWKISFGETNQRCSHMGLRELEKSLPSLVIPAGL